MKLINENLRVGLRVFLNEENLIQTCIESRFLSLNSFIAAVFCRKFPPKILNTRDIIVSLESFSAHRINLRVARFRSHLA